MLVVSVKPFAGFCIIAPGESVERAIQPQEKKRELAFSAFWIYTAACFQSRYECLAGADDFGELLVAKLEPPRRGESCLGKHQVGRRRRGRTLRWGGHTSARYHLKIAVAITDAAFGI